MFNRDNSLGKRIVFIVGVLGIGIASGAAAGSLIAGAIINELGNYSYAPLIGAAKKNIDVDETKVSASRRAAVGFYRTKNGATAFDKVVFDEDKIGNGIVVTADGWIVADFSASKTSGPLLAVFSDRTTVFVDSAKVVTDEATGLAFVKVPASRLEVAAFGDDRQLRFGDKVYAVTDRSVSGANIARPRYLPAKDKTALVESSERLERKIALDQNSAPGAMIVNGIGEVVGVSRGDGTATPIEYFVGVFRSLFGSGKISRPVLGVNYVSLDFLPVIKGVDLPETGALLTGMGKYRAVEKGSVAEVSGLKEGDVIIAVEHDRINSEVTLAERLQDYGSGSKVEFTVLRGKESIKIPVQFK
jgi:S1-C subfamily serine protease